MLRALRYLLSADRIVRSSCSVDVCFRYTGPLGQAAVETAGLTLLRAKMLPSPPLPLPPQPPPIGDDNSATVALGRGRTSAKPKASLAPMLPPALPAPAVALTTAVGVPAALLMSLRAASFKFERPLWDLLLLHEDRWPLPVSAVALMLLAATVVGVTRVLLVHVR